ncbi:MAG: small basic family protein [Armatimonadota bacterium]
MLGIILGLFLGILIGIIMPYEFPYIYARYISCAFLAAFDSVLGAVRSRLEDKFDFNVFMTGFVANTILAGLLTFIGDKLGVELYLAAVLTFGMRIFNNLGTIRVDLLNQRKNKTGAVKNTEQNI